VKQFKQIVYIIIQCLFFAVSAETADIIIHSFDRPIQLYALLESLDVYTENLESIQVIYLVSNDAYEKAYQKVWHDFPGVEVYRQGKEPYKDFKPLTMQALSHCTSEYVLFAVDDIIVKDFIDFDECIKLIKKHNAYGFYFRLGKHLNYCYSMSSFQPLPHFSLDDGKVCLWQFTHGRLDWDYPHTVDMALYPKCRVESQLKHMNFASPNHLEGEWASRGVHLKNKFGLCYVESKMVNLPLNRVQNVFGNKHMNFLSAADLLQIFNDGKKIDILPLYKIQNRGAHMEYEPLFVDRVENSIERKIG
jgi:hypothetical protein